MTDRYTVFHPFLYVTFVLPLYLFVVFNSTVLILVRLVNYTVSFTNLRRQFSVENLTYFRSYLKIQGDLLGKFYIRRDISVQEPFS